MLTTTSVNWQLGLASWHKKPLVAQSTHRVCAMVEVEVAQLEEERQEEVEKVPTDVVQIGHPLSMVVHVQMDWTVSVHLANRVSEATHFFPPILPPTCAAALELVGVEVHQVAWTGDCAGWRSRGAVIALVMEARLQAATPTTAEGQSNSPGITITKRSVSITVEISHS